MGHIKVELSKLKLCVPTSLRLMVGVGYYTSNEYISNQPITNGGGKSILVPQGGPDGPEMKPVYRC